MLLKSIHIAGNLYSLHAGFTFRIKSGSPETVSVDSPENLRKQLANYFHLSPEQVAYLEQIHSGKVVVVENPGFQGKGDAMISKIPNILLTVKVADCIPVIFWNIRSPVISAVHAGWKGLKNKIIENTIENLFSSGISTKNTMVLIGPHLKKCHFEVTGEFTSYFPEFYFEEKDDRIYFDPTSYLYHLLVNTYQIPVQNIIDFSTCTYCDPFCYSYRRDQKTENRQLGYIILK